jgi:hypothetical protein
MNTVNLRFLAIALTILTSCSKDSGPNQDENITVNLSISSTTIYNNEEIELTANPSSEIKEVKFYLDGTSIGSVISSPYKLKYIPKDVDPGQHDFKSVAISDNNNEFSASISTTLVLRLGDSFKGGKIFYLETSGLSGLIASTEDLNIGGNEGFFWGQEVMVNTTKDNGQINTQKMIPVSPSSSYAAYYFKNGYNHNGYSDWYIPAISELKILKEMKDVVGGFTNDVNWKGNYWSSSELNASNAEALHFNVLMGNYYNKQSYALKIRPIRKF